MDRNEIASLLLKIGCLKVSPKEPFTYASGLKGPMYCDNRKILAHVNERGLIIDEFVRLIEKLNIKFDSLCGLATAGIPHGALIAAQLNKPFIYVRAKPKEHGKRNQVEGHYQINENTLLIEDLVNQGKSLEEAVIGIREAGLNPVGCLSIVDYEMSHAKERLKKLNLDLHSLTDFSHIIETAVKLNIIENNDKDTLVAWQKNPKDWQ